MREGHLVILTSKGDVAQTAVLGNEPVHMCLQGQKVLATSSNSYLFEEREGGVRKYQVALRGTRLLCALEDGFAAVTSDVSLASITPKLDYHMTFDRLKHCPACIKRLLCLGAFTLLLLDATPCSVLVIDSVSPMKSSYETVETLQLAEGARYFSMAKGSQDRLFYVAGDMNKKGIMHVCRLFPSVLVSTIQFECPVYSLVTDTEFIYIGAGPQLFLAKLTSECTVESLCSVRVSDTVRNRQIVDLQVVGEELLVTQNTFGVLLYRVAEEKLELVGRGRLHNQLLSAGVIWGDNIVCLDRNGDLYILTKELICAVTGKISLHEGGRKLLVSRDGSKVMVFTMCGSVFALRRDLGTSLSDLQKSIFDTCPALEKLDFSSFRASDRIVTSTQTDLDFLKHHCPDSTFSIPL